MELKSSLKQQQRDRGGRGRGLEGENREPVQFEGRGGHVLGA